MATRVMVIWILILQVMWAGVFVFFNRHFDQTDYEKHHVALLQDKLTSSARSIAKLQLSFSEYKDAVVAAGVKIDNKTGWNDERRMIASVLADPDIKEVIAQKPGKDEFAQAKKIFVSGDFHRSAELFEDFVTRYPDNPSLPQAYYLLGESYYSSDQSELCVKAIDHLISHFPETEFAGYGLLRLGKIYEQQQRPEEAAEMYKTVISNFSKSNSAYMAKSSLKELDL